MQLEKQYNIPAGQEISSMQTSPCMHVRPVGHSHAASEEAVLFLGLGFLYNGGKLLQVIPICVV